MQFMLNKDLKNTDQVLLISFILITGIEPGTE